MNALAACWATTGTAYYYIIPYGKGKKERQKVQVTKREDLYLLGSLFFPRGFLFSLHQRVNYPDNFPLFLFC